MKKYKLSIQLSILFISIFVISGVLFSILTFSRIGDYSESATINRLSMLVESNKTQWDDPNEAFYIDTEKLDVAYIRIININDRDYFEYSKNLLTIVNEREALGIINDVIRVSNRAPNTSGSSSKKTKNGNTYYSYLFSENNNCLIAVTNSKYTDNIKFKMTSSVFYIFIIVSLATFIIIFIWSESYTTRLYRLNKHVKDLPTNNYKGVYLDDGNDEIADLSKTIEGMRQNLEESEGEKREMLQNISHDFKTPIAVIRSYSEAIKDGVEGEEGLDIIINQCDLLESKVYKLLQYNKLEYLSKDRDFQEIKMKNLIEEVSNTYKHKNNIELVLNLDDSIFIGYEENFYTVIDNILDNAYRYAKGKIEINLSEGVLSIYNDGDHIDEKFITGLFKAYEKGSKGQFGLGMSIVKKTLDFFGYQLEVKNENIGVTFTISKAPNTNINLL